MPSYGQIAATLGFQARNAAYKLTQRLITSGHLVKASGGRLAPGPRFFSLDLSEDEVRAGFQAESAGSGVLQEHALNMMLVHRPSKTIMVRVRGDSMVDAGILSGDIAMVEVGALASQGDIVVAEIDQAHTIKEYRVVGGKPCLVPYGIQTEPVTPTESLNIVGIVRGIARSYKSLSAIPSKPGKQGVSQ